ncbi:MAG: sulfatase [Candidatus Cryptobacteroides sp.]
MRHEIKYSMGSILAVAGSTMVCNASGNMPSPEKRPNVLIILTDDQNTNTVGCYTPGIPTPNIDRLAANGVRFTNANVVTTVSSPSRYSILTGRYYNSNYSEEFLREYPEGTVTCFANSCYLEKDGNNLAGILRAAGYRTGFTGKFHLTGHQYLNTNREWGKAGLLVYPKDSDPRKDKVTDRKMHANHEWWCERIRDFGFDYVAGVYPANLRETFNDYTNAHNAEWNLDAALKFLDESTDDSRPFFLMMATTYPHGPAPQTVKDGKFVNSFDNPVCLTGEGVRNDLEKYNLDREKIRRQYAALCEENPEVPSIAASAMWWDNVVGRLVGKLAEIGEEDNTIIIYMSDHGVLNGGKTSLYETGVNIPLVMQWKSGIPAGITYDHLVGSIDIVPTVLDLCGVEPEDRKIDGISISPAFSDPSVPVRDVLLMEIGYARAVKTDDYKYIAIRYPEQPETATDAKTGLPYIMKHTNLAKKSAAARPNYFLPDQVYDYKSDNMEKVNLFGTDPDRDRNLRNLMEEELGRYSKRPFGEFHQNSGRR